MKPISKKLLLLACAAATASTMAVTAFAQPRFEMRKVTIPYAQAYQGLQAGCNTTSLRDILESCRPQLGNSGCGLNSCPNNSCNGNASCNGNHWGSCLPSFPGQPDWDDDIIDKPDNRPDTPNTPDTPDTETPDNTLSAYAKQVADLVNEERAKAGLPALTVDVKVQSAAQVRAKEIVSSFAHTRPDGSGFSSALTQAGASFRGAGENIAYGQSSPQQVMQVWMNSSGHRANILGSNYTSIGVGCYQSASGTLYWTQLFTY